MHDQDRRQHQRIPAHMLVDWHVPGTRTTVFSSTEDIGLGGLRIRTLTPPKPGSRVSMVLRRNADQETLRMNCRVAWVRLDESFCGMGLAFPADDKKDRALIQAVLSKIAPNPTA